MEAKKAAYATSSTMKPDWDQVRITAMAWTLSAKMQQHVLDRFGNALLDTGNATPVVEMSHGDPFWGAKPDGQTLTGVNSLGRLLNRLRDEYRSHGKDPEATAESFLEGLDLSTLTVNGRPVSQEQ